MHTHFTKIYKPGYRYQKAGVMLMELSDSRTTQLDLFGQPSQRGSGKSTLLVQTLDRINLKRGRGTLRLAVEGHRHAWKVRTDYPSARYTTWWSELPMAHAK